MRVPLIRFSLRALAMLPLPLNHALGYLIGMAFYLIPNNTRRICQINIDLCLPDYDARQRRQLLRKSLTETGKSLTEIGALWLWKPEKLMRKIKSIDHEQVLQQAQAKDKGIIILTPHLGSWELTSLYIARQWPITCLYRPPRMQALEDLIKNARERTGARLVPTNTRGVKALYTALADKQSIGILPDQDPGQGGSVFAPFFGVPASTIKLVSRLTQKTGAPVILTTARRLPRGRGYQIDYLQADDDIYSPDAATSAAAMNRAVEKFVRQNIVQYQWSYKRFKTQPDDKTSPYNLP